MFEKLKQKSILKQTSKVLNKRDTSNRNVSMKTLGFLVDETLCHDFEKLKTFSKECNLKYKDVRIFSYKEIKKKLPSLVQNQTNNKDFSWRGEINNQNANEFLEIPFDVMVGFYSESNVFMDLMMAKSKAKFKVGFGQTDPRILDLVLHVEASNFKAFKSEFIKYLKIFNKI